MKLTMRQPSPNLTIFAAEIGDVRQTIVADTASGTAPVPFERWVADQGGTRPVEVLLPKAKPHG